MSERQKPYPFDAFEPAWQARWESAKSFRTPNPGDPDFDASKPKFYVLDMFPYPSGAGLHVGHPEGYTATDILGRTKRRQGFNVLHPMGWDSFGLPAEQYAIKTGQHPRVTTDANIDNFRRQLKSLGFGYDWDREIATTEPGYVRWTQWIFLQLYHSYFDEKEQKAKPVSELEAKGWTREQIDDVRLAFVAEAPVNWSPDLGTVLANEEVEEWRSKGHTVERRPLRQWMLRITNYAQRLIDELEPLDWPEGIKLLQRNWIGRSEGAEVEFDLEGHPVTVFTTRPDTLFGATYMVLAPEHPLVAEITTPEQKDAVETYVQGCAAKSDMERGELNKDKTGVFTGAHAINPVNNEKVPVWIADYVMMGYGTGAIMAVPAHDTRDFEFATDFELPIVQVVASTPSRSTPSRSTPSRSTPSRSADVPSASPYLSEQDPISIHRRRLPHWQQEAKTYFVTWRLADSLPEDKLAQWRQEREQWCQLNPEPWTEAQEAEYHERFSTTIDTWLDAGHGECLLRDPAVARVVSDALHHFDNDRYALCSFVVMPNHVHVLLQLEEGEDLGKLLQSWKGFTAKEINKALGREGTLWQREYWDRLIRCDDHYDKVLDYIRRNPERASLAAGESILYLEENADGTSALLEAFTDPGISINSGFITGLPTAEAKQKMNAWLEEQGKGRHKIQYKLRDWLFSRQRYWGEPFPIVWADGNHDAVPESDLPVLQPEMDDFKPTGDPRGPLVKASEWIRYSDTAQRETNTMPQWAGSCWYYLRYCDPRNTDHFIDPEVESYWAGSGTKSAGMIDLYVGGTEHAVLHLLYARFWHKVLHDLGHVSTREPFQRLVNQGLILGEDGRKMSKSLGNVVNPDDVVREYGADSLRLYEMFMGPLEQVKPWSMKGVEGVSRFLARVWRVALEQDENTGDWSVSPKVRDVDCSDKALRKVVHETIKKVTEDIEKLSFNTAISQMMICTNAFTQAEVVPLKEFTQLLTVLNPFAPHISEEIHQRLVCSFGSVPCSVDSETEDGTRKTSTLLCDSPWPAHDESALVEDEVELVVQVNGKLRDKIKVAREADKDAIEATALAAGKVLAHTEGKTIRKVIVVPGRLVNIVAN